MCGSEVNRFPELTKERLARLTGLTRLISAMGAARGLDCSLHMEPSRRSYSPKLSFGIRRRKQASALPNAPGVTRSMVQTSLLTRAALTRHSSLLTALDAARSLGASNHGLDQILPRGGSIVPLSILPLPPDGAHIEGVPSLPIARQVDVALRC